MHWLMTAAGWIGMELQVFLFAISLFLMLLQMLRWWDAAS